MEQVCEMQKSENGVENQEQLQVFDLQDEIEGGIL